MTSGKAKEAAFGLLEAAPPTILYV